MAEHLGIVTRYQDHELTHAAIHVAERALAQGYRVTLCSCEPARHSVCTRWDGRVLSLKKHPLREWAGGCSRLLWMEPPRLLDVQQARHNGVRTWLFASWEGILPQHEAVFSTADAVICPYRSCYRALAARWPSQQVLHYLPWDVPVPLSVREPSDARRLCFPLYDTQWRRHTMGTLAIMRAALEDPRVEVVAGIGAGSNEQVRRVLKALVRQYPDRVVLEYRPNGLRRLILFAKSQLTVWPTRYESMATIGLTSVSMGTPVLAWKIQPLTEYLEHGQNAHLVPCSTTPNWLGVPEVQTASAVFIEALQSLLQDDQRWATLHKDTAETLAVRRQQHEEAWNKLWNL